ncbi:MAG: ATP synthase F0 subunit B [Byssovorax sp.]
MIRARSSRIALALALGLAGLLSAGAALAQQPGAQPPTAPPGNPPPGGVQVVPGPGQQMPNGIQVRKIDPKDLPPSFRAPGGPLDPQRLPGGRPVPGALPGGRMPPGKGLPPGFRRPSTAVPEEPEKSHEEEECPGHRPLDIPHAPNWWRGILMVNNELAESKNPLMQLLFRYENHDNPCDEKNQPPPFLASVLNFALLAWILARFGKKPLAEALLKRKNEIMQEIETAETLKEDAERRLDEYEQKLETMEETLEELRAEFAAQAEQEKKSVLAEAEERRVRMRKDAEFRIEQEMKSARAQVLQEAVVAAVAAAEALLVKRTTASDLDKMAEDYLKSVGAALKADAQPGAAQ